MVFPGFLARLFFYNAPCVSLANLLIAVGDHLSSPSMCEIFSALIFLSLVLFFFALEALNFFSSLHKRFLLFRSNFIYIFFRESVRLEIT